jgi:uncharacterized protein (TIGR04255 family)
VRHLLSRSVVSQTLLVKEHRKYFSQSQAFGGATIQNEPHGQRLTAHEQAGIAIINTVSLVTSCLAPYPGWPKLREQAHANWTDCVAVAGNRQIARIGVRYINRVDIPLPTTTRPSLLRGPFSKLPFLARSSFRMAEAASFLWLTSRA